MAAAPSFRRGEVIARRYQVVTKSGETALWVGYHAVDQGSASHPAAEQRGAIPEPDVLVKVVKPDLCPEPAMREKLVRDLHRMRGLQHPGMPRLMDVQLLEEHNTVVLIEAIQAGLSQGVLLRRMATFRQKERFPLAEVRQIGAQLASALSYIHGQMLCHGDLRLESVLLRPDGAKLCDIGLGAALPRSIYLEAVKKVNEFELLSPEVRAGRQPDPRADVFGLAALYRHLLSIGQGSGWDALIAEKPAMGLVLTRGMHEDPAQRYSSIEALIADIEAVALTGSQIRRRLAPTPLAMAVAAGRLPVEELSRPMEDLVPESARSRRNSGIFEVGAVLAPLSGAPSAKMSIGTIPPQLGGPNSARSGRILDGTDTNPPLTAREGQASATSRGATSATSKGPTSTTSRGPTSTTSRGATSGISRGGPSSYSLPPVAEAGEAIKSSTRSKDGELGLPPATGAKDPAVGEPPAAVPTGIAGPADETTPYLKNRPPREAGPAPAAASVAEPGGKLAAVDSAVRALPHELSGDDARSGRRTLGEPAKAVPHELIGSEEGRSGRRPLGEPAKAVPHELSSSEEGRSGRRTLGEKLAEGRGDASPRRQSSEVSKSEERPPSSSRSTNSAPRPRSEHASQRSRSGDSGGRQSSATISLASKALITSRLALVGALGLAALIGALIAVVLMLLLRPASLFAPAPAPLPQTAPVKEIQPTPTEPAPMVPVPVVPIEGTTPSAPVTVPSVPDNAAPPTTPSPGAAPTVSSAVRPTLPLRLAGSTNPAEAAPTSSAPVIPEVDPTPTPPPPAALPVAGGRVGKPRAHAPSPKPQAVRPL